MRRATHYLDSLRDGRAVFLDGERVGDVTKHPAFAEPIRRIAQTWDRAAAADIQTSTTYVDAANGRRHSGMWLVPRSADDLALRRRVHRLWAEASYGLMGRTPDHVACVLSAFAGWRQLFDRGGARFGDNVVRFYERARDDDLYVAYVGRAEADPFQRENRNEVHLEYQLTSRWSFDATYGDNRRGSADLVWTRRY